MTTLRQLVDETKRHLLSGQREPRNKLSGSITASTTSITFSKPTMLPTSGSYIEIDQEIIYVWTMVGQVATDVERGQLGSVAATHAPGAVVTVNPKFPEFAIVKAINDDIRDLASPINGLYAVRSVDLTAQTNTDWYNLTGSTDVLEILSVRHKTPGGSQQWSTVSNYELSQNAGTGDFASGSALRITDGLVSGRPIRVLYKASFDPLLNMTDDVTAVSGLPESMHDIPPLGAAMRLVAPREIRRNFAESQGDTRRAGEVPPGAVTSSMRGLAAIRQERITHEAARLAQQHPDRGFIPTGPVGW